MQRSSSQQWRSFKESNLLRNLFTLVSEFLLMHSNLTVFLRKFMLEKIYHLDCWFEGHVQGVGFRYQTLNLAKEFEVSGTVQNLSDGGVHLHVEGDESEVHAFQSLVAETLKNFIHSTKIKTDSRPRTCQGFSIIR